MPTSSRVVGDAGRLRPAMSTPLRPRATPLSLDAARWGAYRAVVGVGASTSLTPGGLRGTTP
eukprot:15449091-Alexandrium_andersonii.AAC.1